MPSIPPRAVRVRPEYGGGGGAVDWGSTLVRDVSGWVEGEFAYVLEDSGWELVWAKNAGSPDSATISYQTTPGTQVTINWVPSSPAIADSYRIRRPDGSLVATVPAPATSWI